MKFELTDEQKMIRKTMRDFAAKKVAPIAGELDKRGEFPTEILEKLAKLGLFGLTVPEEYGGAGLDTVSYAIAIEELSKACASTGLIMSLHNSITCYPIEKFGSKEQKQLYLPQLASGKILGAFALTEPDAGSDISAVQTKAEFNGNEYVLNGTKVFITSGDYAGLILVFARTGSDPHKGLSAFLVEKGMEGFSTGTLFEKLGIHAAHSTELIFENCKVPKENLLGKEGEGFKIAMVALDCGRIGIGAQAVGIAQACLKESIKYAKKRVQFGRPIAKFQAIQWMIANMATKIDAARLLVYRAAQVKDQGKKYTKEAAMAKLFASETAIEAAIKAVQIYGGYGYTKDYPVERYLRDAKITEIYEGTSEIQRLVIANSLLR